MPSNKIVIHRFLAFIAEKYPQDTALFLTEEADINRKRRPIHQYPHEDKGMRLKLKPPPNTPPLVEPTPTPPQQEPINKGETERPQITPTISPEPITDLSREEILKLRELLAKEQETDEDLEQTIQEFRKAILK